jgi:hypothetical protein
MLFSLVWFDDPLAFFTIQSAWGRNTMDPLAAITQSLQAIPLDEFLSGAQIEWHYWLIALDLLSAFAVLVIALMVWRRLGASYGLYSLLSVLLPISSQMLSMSRFVLVVYPLFMMLGCWGRNKLLDSTLKIGFSIFLGILTSVFVNWIFVA